MGMKILRLNNLPAAGRGATDEEIEPIAIAGNIALKGHSAA